MTTGSSSGAAGSGTALRAGLVLAASALGANVFKFSPAEPLNGLQWALVAVGAVLAGAGAFRGLLGPGRPLAAELPEAGRIAGIAVQVALLVAVIHRFQIESPVFFERLIPLAAFGFLVNHLLPARWRLPFFTLLSLAGILLVFGPRHGIWLLAFGAGLIVLCELPVPWAARVLLLLAAGATLALMRSEVLTGPWPASIWPILGSMFMFRLIVYVYDLKHRREPFRPWRAVSYFFMLPNLVFPLFPVVDYTTYGRTYYDGEAARIYQRGLRWMLLGTLHLIAYRIVYQFFTVSPAEVTGVPELGRYVVANFLLYFRVSGQFHLIVGMLHLFGFHLPETHHRFFYSSGFMDFWRRINIYWKDFMMKVVYMPVFFRLRKAGETTALVVATLVVFLVTWLTHSYQWFWILGEWLISLTDMMFWAILAVLVVGSTFREMKRGRKRSLGGSQRTLRETLRHSFRVAVFFAFISLLWSLWTAPTLREWIGMIAAAGIDLRGLALVAGAI
ncbi:MAG TPA: hypothetical protein VKU85_02920, partial [bacterium]|nr:hypothetical protein [bacterium]